MANNFDIANATDKGAADVFFPELWSDEIVAAYKANLVMAGTVTVFNHNGRKGDVINIPSPSRKSANAKSENTHVTLIAHTSTNKTITVASHYEYSVLLEDEVGALALDSVRMFHTDDAGLALATQIDTDIITLGRAVQGGSGTAAYNKGVIGSDGTTAYVDATTNADAIADAGVRRVIQTLDDNNVPQSQRYLVIPPVAKNVLLGLSRFTEQAFVGEIGMANSIRNGRIGNVYGVEVLVSTNCDTATDTSNRVSLLYHRSAFALAEAFGIRVQTQYQLEALGTLLVADTLYGVATLRDDAAVAIVHPG